MALWLTLSANGDSNVTSALNEMLSKRAVEDKDNMLGGLFLAKHPIQEVAVWRLKRSHIITDWLENIKNTDIIFGFKTFQEFEDVLIIAFDIKFRREMSEQEQFLNSQKNL